MIMAVKWIKSDFIAGYEDGSVIYWKNGSGEILHLFKEPVMCIDVRDYLAAFGNAEGGVVLMSLTSNHV
jgi:hypothetical protein